MVRDAKSQLPEMLLLSLPWALPPTAAQASSRISPLPQGNAGVALGIALALALHSSGEELGEMPLLVTSSWAIWEGWRFLLP